MKRNFFIIVLILSLLFFCGCGPRYIIKSDPPIQKVNTDSYSIELNPVGYYGYTGFVLMIENKTEKDIELIWDKTYYLNNDATSGGFMFEGIVYKDRNNPKPPDVIFPKTKLIKTIWPNNLVSFSNGWYNSPMPDGDNGIYVTLNVNGKETREKLTVKLFRESL